MNAPGPLRWEDRVSTSAPTPLHHQVTQIVLTHLGEDEWEVGDRLPHEEQLARHLQVSRPTVRRAYAELAADGWIERRAGRGTTVRRRPAAEPVLICVDPNLGLDQPLGDEELDQYRRRSLRHCHSVEAAAALHGAPCLVIEEQRVHGPRCIAVATWWICDDTVDLTEGWLPTPSEVTPVRQPWPAVIATQLQRPMPFAHVRGRPADRHQADLLGVPVRSPLLEVHRSFAGDHGSPVAYQIVTWPADQVTLAVAG